LGGCRGGVLDWGRDQGIQLRFKDVLEASKEFGLGSLLGRTLVE
jgi:hypothetical protein